MSIAPIGHSEFMQRMYGAASNLDQTKVNSNALPFQNMFESVLTELNSLNTQKELDSMDLALGNVDDPALLAITSTKAEIAMTSLIEMRNKMLDAYSEIMRLSI